MFFIPMLAGAAIGALTNKDNRLQGALLGGALGGLGGQFMPGLLGGSAPAATGKAVTGQGLANLGSGFSEFGIPEMVASNPFSKNALFAAPPPPVELSFADKMLGYGGKAMEALNSNPTVAMMGMNMAQSAMQPPPPGPILQGQIQRGQIAPPNFGGAQLPQRRQMSLLG